MPNPKLETYKNKETETVYDLTDAAAQASIITIEGKIPSGASSSNKMATASDITDIWSANAVTGVHNLWEIAKSVVSKTDHGVAFTVNRNSSGQVTSVEASRTSADSTDSYLVFTESYDVSEPMILSGCPSGGGVDKYRLTAYNNSTQAYYHDDGNGVEIPAGNYILMFRYYKAFSSNITIYPMLRLTTDTDQTFAPFAETNQQLTKSKVDWESYAKTGVHQMLPLSVDYIKALNSGRTWNGNSCTHNGVTFTINTDSKGNVTSITRTGTATGFAFLRISGLSSFSGAFILNGGKDANNMVYIQNETTSTQLVVSTGNDVSITLTPTADIINCIIGANPGTSDEQLFYPLLRLASDTNPTFAPYAMTNRELTEAVAVEEKVATTSNAKITLDSTYKKVIRVGRVVQFKVRFVVTEALTSGANDIFDVGFSEPTSQLLWFPITTLSAPYPIVTTVTPYMQAGHMIVNGALAAGTYDMSGTYICKD